MINFVHISFVFYSLFIHRKATFVFYTVNTKETEVRQRWNNLNSRGRLPSRSYSVSYTHLEAIKVYQKADIIVDQLLAGTYGVFALEGMAMGKPVITYITEEMKKTLPGSLPIVSANPDNIKEKLEMLIQDGQLRRKLGKEGRVYVEAYHDYKKNAKLLGRIYEGKAEVVRGPQAFEEVNKGR